uniref:Arginine biosynthesis bifunctional protein ArgJ n=1 Tax=Anthurium amnicola TaxID=1678845 RepID=A0A1D1ZH06_9ARAE
MKLQSFYSLTAIFMCFYMTFIPVIEAYDVSVNLDLNSGSCRIWIEDVNHNRIAGDGKGDYHACDGTSSDYEDIEFSDQEYYVVAKVELSFRKQKVRGSFNANTCFRIHGTIDFFHFEQTSC